MKRFPPFPAYPGMAAAASPQALPSESVTIADGRGVVGGEVL